MPLLRRDRAPLSDQQGIARCGHAQDAASRKRHKAGGGVETRHQLVRPMLAQLRQIAATTRYCDAGVSFDAISFIAAATDTDSLDNAILPVSVIA